MYKPTPKTYNAKVLICEVYDLPAPPVPIREPYPEEIKHSLAWFLAHTITNENGCMIWQKHVHPVTGYGTIGIGFKHYYAHRLVALLTVTKTIHLATKVSELFSRKIQACHTCDNPPCINPDHLILADAMYNHWDAVKKGRKQASPAFYR